MPLRRSLVSTAWLAEHIGDPAIVVADVRWYLKGKHGRDEYSAGHLPTAIFVDVDLDLSSPPGPGRPGRHPLPTTASFAKWLARAGIGPKHVVVAYDDQGGATAARLWWLLRYFGHGGGRVLDGGLQAWVAEGRPLEVVETHREPAEPMRLYPKTHMVVQKPAVAELVARKGALLLDARAAERFEGKVEPVDARPGHIPGAKSAPFAENLVTPGGTFRSAEDLAKQYGALGALTTEHVVAYCGSGVTACQTLLALELGGRNDGRLYEGSWSEWAGDPNLPAALGKT